MRITKVFTQDLHRMEIAAVMVDVTKEALVINNFGIGLISCEYAKVHLGDIEVKVRINYGYDKELCKRVFHSLFKELPQLGFKLKFPYSNENEDTLCEKISAALEFREWYLP